MVSLRNSWISQVVLCAFESNLNVAGRLARGISVLQLSTALKPLIYSLKIQKALETENVFVGL